MLPTAAVLLRFVEVQNNESITLIRALHSSIDELVSKGTKSMYLVTNITCSNIYNR